MKNFPTRAPIGMLLGAVLGLLSVVPILAIWHHYRPPLERFYLPQYVGSILAQTPMGTVVSFFNPHRRARTYFLLMRCGKPATSGAATDPSHPLSVQFVQTSPRIFGLWLQNQIYSGRKLHEVVRVPLAIWAVIGVSSFLCGLAWDFRSRRRAREGVRLRGPDLLTRREFNRVTKGDGFTLYVRD